MKHQHKCCSCGHEWEHDDTSFGNKAAHTCPCGDVQSIRYKAETHDQNCVALDLENAIAAMMGLSPDHGWIS